MTGPREAILLQAADLLLDARRTGNTLTDLPPELQPADQTEAYFIQDLLAEAYGPIGGYKIGAPTPDATPIFAPMPRAWMAASGSTLVGNRFRGLEAEIAFLVGKDLPPRDTPYARDEILAAMASCHPVIEILESGLTNPMQAAKLSSLSDLQMHGGLVYGPAFPDWQTTDFHAETVILTVDGVIREERIGSNTSGDLLRLLPWLANEGATRTGGLQAGQWITTGSWTGYTLADARSTAVATFKTAGRVDLHFV